LTSWLKKLRKVTKVTKVTRMFLEGLKVLGGILPARRLLVGFLRL